MKKLQLTKEGYENLKKEYQELKEKKRPLTAEKLERARSMGDLSENSAYTAAKEELNLVEGRIQEIKEIIDNAEIVVNDKKQGVISLGATVIVESEGKQEQIGLVGEFEADPIAKKISATSPIGKALLGKKVGEIVEIEVPAGRIIYKIVAIK